MWSDQAEAIEAQRWIDDALARLDSLPATEGEAAVLRSALRTSGEITSGYIASRNGDSAKARILLSEAVANARRIGDETLLTSALGFLALALHFVGDIPAMRAVAKENVALARRLGRLDHLGMGLIFLAEAKGREGDMAARRAYLAEATALSANFSRPMAGSFYYILSQEARGMGELDAARSYLQMRIPILPLYKDRADAARFASELAHIERQSGELDTAQKLYRDTILQWKDLGQRAAVAHQFECFGFIAQAQGQPNRAVRLLGAADRLREAIGAPMTDFERAEYIREITALREQLDEATFAAEWVTGCAMSMDEAVAYAIQES
jgi:hypothetical protein